MKPRVLDLFSGIGGFTLAFEAAGFETIAFSEIEPYPCKILAQHWPEVPNLGDIRKINDEDYRGAVDVICGGFPCQDISVAGKGLGLDGGERSILWYEMLRIIRGARPAFCLIENVPALRTKGADGVLNGLEEAGYTARPFVVGAVHAGAPHRRQRVWIVAYRNKIRCHLREHQGQGIQRENETRNEVDSSGTPFADTQGAEFTWERTEQDWQQSRLTDAGWWTTEPNVGGSLDGISNWLDRIGGMSDEAKTRATKILRDLWDEDFQKEIQQQVGRFGGISQAEILLAVLCEYEEGCYHGRKSLESRAIKGEFLRKLWHHIESARSPHRRKYRQQFAIEYSNALRSLPHYPSSCYPEAWIDGRWEAGLERVSNKIPNRAHRIKALGNSIVPQVAYPFAQWIHAQITEKKGRKK